MDTGNKARRTRDLCLALARNRCDSATENGKTSGRDSSDFNRDFPPLSRSRTAAQPKKESGAWTTSTTDDGWIEERSQIVSTSHPRLTPSAASQRPIKKTSAPTPASPILPAASSQSSLFSPIASTIFPYPIAPTAYFSTFAYPKMPHPYTPSAAAAVYIQMQMQVQSQMQRQLHLHPQAHGGHLVRPSEWFSPHPPMPPPYAIVPPHIVQVPATALGIAQVIGYNRQGYADLGGNITGSSGMRHVL